MNSKKWTTEEEKFLTDNYNNYLVKDLADKMGRTYSSVEKKAGKLGLKKEEVHHEEV